MLSVSILGNGPSIKFYRKKNSFNDLIIGTNNIFYLKQFNLIKQENNYYTAYDERFFKKGFENWTHHLERFKGKIFFPSSWKNKKELKNLKKINFFTFFLRLSFHQNAFNFIKFFKCWLD